MDAIPNKAQLQMGVVPSKSPIIHTSLSGDGPIQEKSYGLDLSAQSICLPFFNFCCIAV